MPNETQAGVSRMDDSVVHDSMQIILHAGDARTISSKALTAATNGDIHLARELIEQAHEELLQAHQIHTDRIQSEAEGNCQEYSLLFAHAQDTLMTITSEVLLTKRLIGIVEGYNSRIESLEARLAKLENLKED